MSSASELADRLARNAEAFCRHYLPAGRRAGNYWIVGDVANNKGKSLYVHLSGPRKGRWADAATAQFGDLLDLVRETCGLVDFRDVADEARRFLNEPQPGPASSHRDDARPDPPVDRPANERAQRLFRMTQPLAVRWPTAICASGASWGRLCIPRSGFTPPATIAILSRAGRAAFRH